MSARYSASFIVLVPAAAVTWAATIVLVCTQLAGETPQPLATFLGLVSAVLTVGAMLLWMRDHPHAVSTIYRISRERDLPFERPAGLAPVRTTATMPVIRIPATASRIETMYDAGETVEIDRRMRAAVSGLTAVAVKDVAVAERDQAYWDGVADLAETMFELREDDPPTEYRG